ncbi:MAG: hypothetical protein EOO86_05100 [Pedobacter sp.]|nr:MAG: hypothetical protein EOO86_05100 [Pedobacter sp.]
MSEEKSLNFIEEIVENDLNSGKYETLVTHFGLTQKYGGYTNLRFDDTNPVTEKTEYVNSQQEDIKWLGFNWKNELYASDYFDELYSFAVKLIEKGLAYVDESSADEIAALKGTPTEPGQDSPYRNRSVEENLDIFTKMKNGEFADGAYILRAKIDMASPNMLMRDPIIYRIKHAEHHRTGNKWCIYPMYDFAHGQSDSIENITHSICTLEYVSHRELYDWFIEKLEIFPSKQYEFARLNLTSTVMSKRKLLQLVNENLVSGWDDPRMPTISGLRRRGIHCTYIPESKSGNDTSGINVKGTIHWVSAQHAKTAEIRLYDRLFTSETPDAEEGDFKDYLNAESLTILPNAYIEPALADADLDSRYQFIRKGYFCLDKDSTADKLVFNRTVTLKDTFKKPN